MRIGRLSKFLNAICLFALGRKAAFSVYTWIRHAVDREFDGELHAARYAGCTGIIQQFTFRYEKNSDVTTVRKEEEDA